ncbi:hypothetical protein [Vibrio rumoiensis]|uniref:hypothetical protein n=1 Tax=Vibrio rumoiensis TaxID=76258 RepID=UPI0038CD4E4A
MLIDELWEQLRHYEDKLTTSSKTLQNRPHQTVLKIAMSEKDESSGGRNSRGAKKATQGINENFPR